MPNNVAFQYRYAVPECPLSILHTDHTWVVKAERTMPSTAETFHYFTKTGVSPRPSGRGGRQVTHNPLAVMRIFLKFLPLPQQATGENAYYTAESIRETIESMKIA